MKCAEVLIAVTLKKLSALSFVIIGVVKDCRFFVDRTKSSAFTFVSTLFSLLFVTLCSPSFYFCYTFLRLFSPFAKENDIGTHAGHPACLPRLVGGRGSAGKSESRGHVACAESLPFFPTCFTCSLPFLFHLAPALFHLLLTFILPCFQNG